MTRPFRLSTLVISSLLAAPHAAQAQSSAAPASGSSDPSQASASISATGKRMPGVGESKSGPETNVEKKAEQKMNKETSICNGC